jgi:hypothetical protein
MRKLMLLLLWVPLLAWGQSPFDGTWKVNIDSAKFPTKPDVLVYQKGMYTCKSCTPSHTVKADGQWHKITGDPYMDEMMVKIIDDKHSEQYTRKNGKETGIAKVSVSDDGQTRTTDWVDKSSPNGKDVSGKAVQTRVAAGPAGSLPLSGSWRTEKVSDVPSEGLLFTYKSTPDGMDFSTPTGQSYSAKFNGGFVPIQGDLANTEVSIKKMGANTLQETNQRGGKVVGVSTMVVEGNKMRLEFQNKENGTTMKMVADKQ